MILPKPISNALKSSALLSNTSGRTRSRPLFDKRSLSTLVHSPNALLPSAAATSAPLRASLLQSNSLLRRRLGTRAFVSVLDTNDAQHHDIQTLSTTTTVDSPILNSLASSNSRPLNPTYYDISYRRSNLDATYNIKDRSSSIDTDHVDPFDVMDTLQFIEATFPQFKLPAAFYEQDSHPDADTSESIPGSGSEDDEPACNAETLLEFMLQPLEESGLFSMSPEVSPETTQLLDSAAAAYDDEALRDDCDLALEQLQQLSVSSPTQSPIQSAKRKRESSPCVEEEETRIKRSRALSEDNYDFPDEIPAMPPSSPIVLSPVPMQRKRQSPSSDEDDEMSTPSPKRPRSESYHEYDFLAEALLTSTPPYTPPKRQSFTRFFDEDEYLDSEYDASASQSTMTVTDLLMDYEAGEHPIGSPPSASGPSDIASRGTLHHSYAPSVFSAYREAEPIIWNDNDILGMRPAHWQDFEERSDEILDKDEDDFIVNILSIAFSSKLRLEYCSVCQATMTTLCRCKLDAEIEPLCFNCDSLLLPYCACVPYFVHTLPRPRKGMEPPHSVPYSRADRTLWHAPFIKKMDVDCGLSMREMAMLDLSMHNTTIDSDTRRRRRKMWRSWKFGWIGDMITQSRSFAPIPRSLVLYT